MFGNDYIWKTLVDPTDSYTLQVDAVSQDNSISGAKGSIWPLVMSTLATDLGVPVGIIPTALGGTNILSWQPGADHQDRTTLYGSMVYRGLGGSRCILVWQGESDELQGTSRATYNSRLDTFANTAFSDLGVKTMWAKLQNCAGTLDSNHVIINNAIGDAWGDNSNVLTGPDLSDINSEDDFHVLTNALGVTVAARWVSAIKTAFGW